MTILKKDGRFECGINDDGELYLSNDGNGYNLQDTPENRERIFADFDYWRQPPEGYYDDDYDSDGNNMWLACM